MALLQQYGARSVPGRMKLFRSSCTVIGLPFHMPIGISSRTTLL